MEKALVLLSGGQDSATCLSWALTIWDEIHTVSFDYGQRHRAELECSEALSKMSGAKSHTVIPINSFTALGESALVKDGDIGGAHELNANLPASFVPGRNYVFLGLAAALAYKLGIPRLVTGVCQTDYSGYPDCRDSSIKSVQVALEHCLDMPLVIHTPLMWLTKAQTVKLMNDLGTLDWYQSTMTCYNGEMPPCGECPACKLRAKGFKEAGFVDPLLMPEV